MVVALHDAERVARHFLAGDEPRRVFACAARCTALLQSADADALALAKCVEAQAHVLADRAAAVVRDRTRRIREVAVQELAERPLADEADAGRIFLLRIRQADLGGDAAHLGLRQFADREPGFRELRLRQAMQEVALVFQRVEALEQLERTGAARVGACRFPFPNAGVMARGDLLCAEPHRVIEKGLELDLGVAQHVGVRRAAGFVLAQELGEDTVLVVGCDIDVLDLDAEHVGDCRRIDEVDVRRAVLVVVIALPVLHEDADDLVPLLFEQVRGDG